MRRRAGTVPEGDTVHKVAAAMAPRLAGVRLVRIEVAPRHGAAPRPARVTAVRAHGKHLLLDLDGGSSLRVHLGMYGSWHRYLPGEAWKKPARRASVMLDTGSDVFVCFSAKEVEVLRTSGTRARDLFARLGPDLVAHAARVPALATRARELNDADSLLADVLLDQRVASGIGNVYKSEVLFLESQPPRRRLGDVDDEALERCFGLAARLLARNLAGGPRVTRSIDDGRGRLWVYGRDGAPCLRCGRGPVRRELLGRAPRSTYSCPTCQRP
jgi:endonuclease-8